MSFFCFCFFSVAQITLGNIEKTDKLAASEILCRKGSQNLALVVALTALLVLATRCCYP